jgi:hypothetical protein
MALARLRSYILRIAVCAGALLFLAAVTAGFYSTGTLVKIIPAVAILGIIFNKELIIPFCEMLIVGCGIFGIFVALTLLSKSGKNAE